MIHVALLTELKYFDAMGFIICLAFLQYVNYSQDVYMPSFVPGI